MTYKFVNLSPEQIEARRHALDRAGWHAWLGPVVLLVVVYMYRRFSSRFPGTRKSTRRIGWTLGTTHVSEFGPLSVQLFGLAYTAWLLFLTFRGAGEDYMHLTKAFGHVGVSQMPLQYLMSVKSPVSPVAVALGSSHEKINVYHRFLGRVVHLFLAIHAILYLRFFAKMGFLEKRLGDWDVRFGLLSFWTVNFLGLLSLPAVRRRAYHALFWRSHVVLALALPVFVFLHVKWTRVYVGQVAVVWMVNVFMRKFWASEVVQVRCEDIQGTATTGPRATNQLIQVKMGAKKGERLSKATPGQHVYVHAPNGGGAVKNPFTIVSVTDSQQKNGVVEVMLVVRRLGGPGTKWLAEMAKTGKSADVRVEGPYGDAGRHIDRLMNVETTSPVLLVAGGVGATYTIPIYMSVLNHAREHNTQRNIKMVWLVKNVADAAWGAETLRRHLHGTEMEVDLYVTGESAMSSTQRSNMVISGGGGGGGEILGFKIHTLGKRPNLVSLVDDFFTPSNVGGQHDFDTDEVNVFVCGPASMSADLREVVGRHVMKPGIKVRWVEEVFGFGGS